MKKMEKTHFSLEESGQAGYRGFQCLPTKLKN